MEQESTTGVDTSELSDSVIEDLAEEEGLDEEKAEELGNDIWFDEVNMREPERTGLRTYVKSRLDTGVGLARRLNYAYREEKTVFAEVTGVERTSNDNVKLTFEHERTGEDSFVLSPDSVGLANLLEYHSAENRKDLVGENILLDPSSFSGGDTTVIIPHNVAWTGKIRFATFSFFTEVNEKLKWDKSFNNGEDLSLFVLSLFPCTILSLFGVISIGVFPELLVNLLQIPIVLWFVLFTGHISHIIFRLIILSILSVLDSDFEEV
jgi:hypothetical protein